MLSSGPNMEHIFHPFRSNGHKVADPALFESTSLQIALYLGPEQLHTSRYVEGFHPRL